MSRQRYRASNYLPLSSEQYLPDRGPKAAESVPLVPKAPGPIESGNTVLRLKRRWRPQRQTQNNKQNAESPLSQAIGQCDLSPCPAGCLPVMVCIGVLPLSNVRERRQVVGEKGPGSICGKGVRPSKCMNTPAKPTTDSEWLQAW